jgi:hypothetical protein
MRTGCAYCTLCTDDSRNAAPAPHLPSRSPTIRLSTQHLLGGAMLRAKRIELRKILKRSWLVGAAGFEPATTRTPSVCATRLRHAPTVCETATNALQPVYWRRPDNIKSAVSREVADFHCSVYSSARRRCSHYSAALADRCAASSIASAPMTTLSGR